MEVAIVGLGRMGSGVVERLLSAGHRVVVYNRTAEKAAPLVEKGAVQVHELEELPRQLSGPRAIWFYLPAGEVTDEHISQILPHLEKGDVVIDGGNSHFVHTVELGKRMKEKGVHFLDVGTSGGIRGRTDGYCLMIGGEEEQVASLRPLWEAVACPGGYARVGSLGAGHYVKMVHNAIEYGMMQAYGEGVALLDSAPGFAIPVAEVSRLWQNGSIIRSFLGELLAEELQADPGLGTVGNRIDDSGEARWAVEQGLAVSVPLPVIAASLFARYQSRSEDRAPKVVNVLRRAFGGHKIVPPKGG